MTSWPSHQRDNQLGKLCQRCLLRHLLQALFNHRAGVGVKYKAFIINHSHEQLFSIHRMAQGDNRKKETIARSRKVPQKITLIIL